MRRLVTLCLLAALSISLSAASLSSVRFGIYHGTWSVTNARTEAVTTGSLSIVYRLAGKPMVHLWLPVETENGTEYAEHYRAASTATRRSLVANLPGVGRVRAQLSPDHDVAQQITGTLQLNDLGRGTFTAALDRCLVPSGVFPGPNPGTSLLPMQSLLRDIYDVPCPSGGFPLPVLPSDPRPVLLPPIRWPIIIFPPVIFPPIQAIQLTNYLEWIEARRTNLHPVQPAIILRPWTNQPPSLDSNAVIIERVPLLPEMNYTRRVSGVLTAIFPQIVTPEPLIEEVPPSP